MIRERSEDENRQLKSDWQAIRLCMNELKIDPTKLSKLTHYPEINIRRGINGEPIPIPESFLRSFVRNLNLVEARGITYQDPLDLMSYDELMKMIKPPPAMPPRQGDFWESPDWED